MKGWDGIVYRELGICPVCKHGNEFHFEDRCEIESCTCVKLQAIYNNDHWVEKKMIDKEVYQMNVEEEIRKNKESLERSLSGLESDIRLLVSDYGLGKYKMCKSRIGNMLSNIGYVEGDINTLLQLEGDIDDRV